MPFLLFDDKGGEVGIKAELHLVVADVCLWVTGLTSACWLMRADM
jgi:hypothetical protein